MLRADDELIYTARKDIKVIVSFQVEKDGVGLRGVNMQEIMKYGFHGKRSTACFCILDAFSCHIARESGNFLWK